MPHHLAVDLSVLANVGDHITAAQIKLPASATLLSHAEEIVASVTEFKEEKEEITPPPETIITTEKAPEEGAAVDEATPEKGEKGEK